MTTVVEHLQNLIRIPSVSFGTNRRVIEYAEAALLAAGWHFRRQTYWDDANTEKINLIAAPMGQPVDDKADLAFVCHTDTVPYSAAWADALLPREANGFIYGCGACDVKGFLACLLATADSLNVQAAAGIRFVLTADEEIGCAGAKQLLAGGRLHARKLVIGEPTSLSPARAGKGYCLAEVRVIGTEAHSAHPEEGASAILGAAHLLIELEKYAEGLKKDENAFFSPSFTTMNVGTIFGGTAKNIIPGVCTFQLEWRPVPGEHADRILYTIQKLIAQLQQTNPHLTYEITMLRMQQGFETSSEASLVRVLEALSGNAAVSIPFGSEASIFADICEEVVVFGPGRMQSAHSDRECVEIFQLEKACAYLRSLMQVPISDELSRL